MHVLGGHLFTKGCGVAQVIKERNTEWIELTFANYFSRLLFYLIAYVPAPLMAFSPAVMCMLPLCRPWQFTCSLLVV